MFTDVSSAAQNKADLPILPGPLCQSLQLCELELPWSQIILITTEFW